MVSLRSQAEADLRAFEEHIALLPEVRECYMLNGEIDFILKVVAKDLQSFQQFLTSKLTPAPNVASVKTSLTIRTFTVRSEVIRSGESMPSRQLVATAVVLTSEGERDAKINSAEGDKQRVIKASEALRQQLMNEAEGQAQAILAVANATAEGLRLVASALSAPGGGEAMQLRIGEEYVKQFGKMAKESTTLVVPSNLADLASVVSMATSITKRS